MIAVVMLSPVNFASSSASRYVSLVFDIQAHFLPYYHKTASILPFYHLDSSANLLRRARPLSVNMTAIRQVGPWLAGKGSSDPETSSEPAVRGVANPGSKSPLPCAGVLPELAGDLNGVNAGGLPPGLLVRARLHKSDVMGVGRFAAAQ